MDKQPTPTPQPEINLDKMAEILAVNIRLTQYREAWKAGRKKETSFTHSAYNED